MPLVSTQVQKYLLNISSAKIFIIALQISFSSDGVFVYLLFTDGGSVARSGRGSKNTKCYSALSN